MAIKAKTKPDDADEAVAWFKGKAKVGRGTWRALDAAARARAFNVAGLTSARAVDSVYKALEKAVAEGTPYKDFARAVKADVEADWGKPNAALLETVFRNHVAASYAAGRLARLREPGALERRPFRLYSAVLDPATTPVCRSRHGVLLPADDPWWQENEAPLHHRCFPAGAPVVTARGAVPIEAVVEGDLVMTHEGRWRRVNALMASPSPDALCEVATASGRRLLGTAEHPALTQRGWVPLAALRPGDHLVEAPPMPAGHDSVGQHDRGQASGEQVADPPRAYPPRAAGHLEPEPQVDRHKVDEVESVASPGGHLMFDDVALGPEVSGEGGLDGGWRRACLNVRGRVGAMPSAPTLGGSGHDLGRK